VLQLQSSIVLVESAFDPHEGTGIISERPRSSAAAASPPVSLQPVTLYGRNVDAFDVDLNDNLRQCPVNIDDLVQSRVKIVLEHSWPRMFEVEVGILPDLG
jgi:hypothetical protein